MARVDGQSCTPEEGLLELADALVVRFDTDVRVLSLNETAERLSGWTTDEARGRTAWETFVSPEHHPLMQAAVELCRTRPEPLKGAFAWRTRAGERRWLQGGLRPVLDDRGQLQEFLAVGVDVTALRGRPPVAKSDDDIWSTLAVEEEEAALLVEPDRDRVLRASRCAERFFDVAAGKLTGTSFLSLFCGDARAEARAATEAAGQGRPSSASELLLADATGCRRYVDLRAFPTDLGRRTVVLAVLGDASERRQQRDASEQLFDLSIDMLAIIGFDGYVRDINPSWETTLGWRRDEVLGSHLADIVSMEDHGRAAEAAEQLLAGRPSQNIELRMLCADGSYRYVEWSAFPAVADGLVYTVGRDVTTQRQQARDQRRRSLFIERAADVLIITTPSGDVEYANPAGERGLGFPAHTLVGKHLPSLLAAAGDSVESALNNALRARESWSGRVALPTPEGSRRHLDLTLSAVHDEARALTGFVLVGRDVSEVVRMERQLRDGQKTEALGTLAAGVAHDFNNILAALLGYAGLCQEQARPDTQLRHDVERVIHAGERARDLVRRILLYARRQEEPRAPVQLGTLVKDSLAMLRAGLPSSVVIETRLATEDGTVMGSSSELSQVITNLCTNAAHAMQSAGGTLTVSLENALHVGADYEPLENLEPGRYMLLRVSDTGPGIMPDLLGRIFDPYFTTKREGEGTGLGLAVSRSIIRAYGGDIHVDSRLGVGSTFSVFLPAAEPVNAGVSARSGDIPRGSERILFVDDETPLVYYARRVLGRLGYDVQAETDSVEALAHLQSSPGAFDLVVTDLTMPRLSGVELARVAYALRPDMPVILCTGFADRTLAELTRDSGIVDVLDKPVALPDLASSIRRALDGIGPQAAIGG